MRIAIAFAIALSFLVSASLSLSLAADPVPSEKIPVSGYVDFHKSPEPAILVQTPPDKYFVLFSLIVTDPEIKSDPEYSPLRIDLLENNTLKCSLTVVDANKTTSFSFGTGMPFNKGSDFIIDPHEQGAKITVLGQLTTTLP